jgi:phage terminase small subunit
MTQKHEATVGVLTPKQRRFVDEYLVDLNATQAAIRAGYSARRAASSRTAHVIGPENLGKPEIAAAVREAIDARAARTLVEADRVLHELSRVAFSDIRTLFDEQGALRNVADLSDDEAAAVAAVGVVEQFEGRGEGRRTGIRDRLLICANRISAAPSLQLTRAKRSQAGAPVSIIRPRPRETRSHGCIDSERSSPAALRVRQGMGPRNARECRR